MVVAVDECLIGEVAAHEVSTLESLVEELLDLGIDILSIIVDAVVGADTYSLTIVAEGDNLY